MQKILNILIASDCKASREALTRTLNSEPFFHVIAVCADAFAAISMTENASPDIVLIDGSTDPLATIQAIKKITACSNANVIGISRMADSDFETHLLAAGALGYVTHNSSAVELVCAVAEVAKDNLYSCITATHEPVPTPARISSINQLITQSIAGIASSLRDRNAKATTNHWHAILQYAN
ncbi:MAG: response regulator [Chitinophagaceae bacterium]